MVLETKSNRGYRKKEKSEDAKMVQVSPAFNTLILNWIITKRRNRMCFIDLDNMFTGTARYWELKFLERY